jgi:hypothetical protein
MVFEFANVDPSLDHGAVSPDIGATQVCYPENFNIFLARHGSLWIGQSTNLALSALCILSHLASN